MKSFKTLFLAFSIFMFLGVINLSSHPAKTMTLSYSEGILQVEIQHSTPSKSRHYIDEVIIKVNGKTVKEVKYDSQPTKNKFVYKYEISAKSGDKITVITKCNIFGKEEASITVE